MTVRDSASRINCNKFQQTVLPQSSEMGVNYLCHAIINASCKFLTFKGFPTTFEGSSNVSYNTTLSLLVLMHEPTGSARIQGM